MIRLGVNLDRRHGASPRALNSILPITTAIPAAGLGITITPRRSPYIQDRGRSAARRFATSGFNSSSRVDAIVDLARAVAMMRQSQPARSDRRWMDVVSYRGSG